MNHLRELIEAIEKKTVLIEDGWLPLENEHALMVTIPRVAESAICFSADIDGLVGIKPVADLCRQMPFECCWFEFNVSTPVMIIGILATTHKDGRLGLVIFRKRFGAWILLANIHTDGEQICGVTANFGEEGPEWAGDMFSLVRTFVTAMRCNNVSKNESAPSEKLQKARTKRGKKPLFSFWTLELKQSRSDNESHGGTHSSPRLHLRRGHPRQYATGKWTWVQPSIVGNKALGMVHKDYLLPK